MNNKKLIESLRISPMFNLSLASKELFHSNMIEWLVNVNKHGMSKLFSSVLAVDGLIIESCQREKKNFDLFIECKNQIVIIENKFKSIVTKDQLEKYNKKMGMFQS